MAETTAWHSRTIESVAEAFGVDLKTGLSDEEVKSRQAQYGPNELVEQPRPGFLSMLLEQFKGFVVLLLIGAAFISLLLGEWIDASAIMAIVILNAVLGVVQQSKAEEALAALKKMAAPEAHVLRNRHRITIPAREVVPGDIVFLEAGNFVPADVRLIESVNLRIDEASLTGESVPVEKRAAVELPEEIPLGDRVNSAFMGTTATYGRGTGIVTAIGMQTQIGQIAEMLQSYEEEETPLQRRLDQLGKWLGVGVLIICGLVFLESVIRDTNLYLIIERGFMGYLAQTTEQLIDLFLIAVSLAVAAVPEGLPAVVTICLAIGMREMVRRHALLRRLHAVETLGSATVICSDKTGTLTQNEMMAARLHVANFRLDVTGEGYQPVGTFYHDGKPVDPRDNPEMMELLKGAMLCSDARLEPISSEGGGQKYRMVGDPTEGAMVVAAAKAGLWREELEAQYPRVAEVPFDSDRKRMSTIHKAGGGRYIAYVKGAPDVVLNLCHTILEDGKDVPLTDAHRQRIINTIRELGRDGLRVLGVAYRNLDQVPETPTADGIEKELSLIGLVAMIDPPRPEVKPAIGLARQAGIRTIMITGDYPETARTVAAEIGLTQSEGCVVSGAELDTMSDEKLREIIEDVDVFARVSPEHKVRIVEALKAHGHIVAMTGDGVNDAPALKRAAIGVAMGITGTDVAKGTADMVLTDDNYASIVSAIEQGRIIYSNIRKFVFFLLSCNMAEICSVFLGTLFSPASPLAAIQLLLVNLFTDGAPALALGMEKGDPDIMQQPPRPVKEPIINRSMVVGIIVQTIAITFAVLLAYFVGLARWGLEVARTMAFVTLAVSELARAYTSRSERVPLVRLGILSNKYMQYAVLVSLILVFCVVYIPVLQPFFKTVPLGLAEWEIILLVVLVPAIVAELTKVITGVFTRRRKAAAI